MQSVKPWIQTIIEKNYRLVCLGSHTKGRLLALPLNIRLGVELADRKTLAYCDSELTMSVKSFKTQVQISGL